MIGERIRLRRKILGLTQSDVAKACSVSKTTVSDWEKGLFKPKNKESLIGILKTNKDWLLTGTGKEEATNIDAVIHQRNKLPLLSWVQAGNWNSMCSSFSSGDAEEYFPCPEETSATAFALKVVGESMYPEYIDGEIIYVDPEVLAENGSYVVVRQNNDSEVTFKKLIIEAGERMLKAVNPNWPNPIIKMLHDAYICGVVIGSYRKRR